MATFSYMPAVLWRKFKENRNLCGTDIKADAIRHKGKKDDRHFRELPKGKFLTQNARFAFIKYASIDPSIEKEVKTSGVFLVIGNPFESNRIHIKSYIRK